MQVASRRARSDAALGLPRSLRPAARARWPGYGTFRAGVSQFLPATAMPSPPDRAAAEKMIVALIEQGDPAGCVPQSASRGEAAKAATEDNHMWEACHCRSGQRLKTRESSLECCRDRMVERDHPGAVKQRQPE